MDCERACFLNRVKPKLMRSSACGGKTRYLPDPRLGRRGEPCDEINGGGAEREWERDEMEQQHMWGVEFQCKPIAASMTRHQNR